MASVEVKPKKKKLLGKSVVIGLIRTLVGFPIEHPIDSIKTQWQAHQKAAHEVAIFRVIWNEKGFRGLYAGGGANLARCLTKNSYRFPMLVLIPNFLNRIFVGDSPDSQSQTRYSGLFQLIGRGVTAISIAAFDAFAMTPFERLKVLFMTRDPRLRGGYFSFLTSHSPLKLFVELYRGYTPLFARQLVGWTFFLQLDLLVKAALRRIWNVPNQQPLSYSLVTLSALTVALLNTSIIMPLDVAKTFMQKHNPEEGLIGTVRRLHRQGGVRALYVGWRMRLLQLISHMLWASHVMEYFEKRL